MRGAAGCVPSVLLEGAALGKEAQALRWPHTQMHKRQKKIYGPWGSNPRLRKDQYLKLAP